MLCKSCKGDVPPKFAHAILVNTCPLCGDVIMDEALQISLKALKQVMEAVNSYPQEIFDWLKSNYSLYSETDVQSRVSEAEEKIKELSRRLPPSSAQSLKTNLQQADEVQLDANGNQISGSVIQPSEQTNKFFKNAEATKTLDRQEQLSNMAKIARQIKKSGSASVSEDSDANGNVVTPEMMGMDSNADPVQLAELRNAFGTDPNEGADPADMDYEDEIPSAVLNMANKAGGGQGVNQRDLMKLQNLQHKSSSAKNQIAKTGSVGLIRR